MANSAISAVALVVKKQVARGVSAPFWQGRKGRRNRVRVVAGPVNSYNHVEGDARIDSTIAKFIGYMNAIGLHTAYCCSGRQCDHDSSDNGGYISMAITLPPSLVKLIPEGIKVENNGVLRLSQFDDPCSGRELIRRWKALEVAVDTWFEGGVL